MALFDTLPGRAENYHPAGIVLTTAQEMIEQCHAARTLALSRRQARRSLSGASARPLIEPAVSSACR
jgi:hypothetical protein